ncbi:hypothetical protein [Ferrimonas balearica]|uniref:hypothetical protein n=1 Tax=Ferrimonas balearica TaxID=44012 RepID=UPI001C99213D|nr:hypothetical protein [Ferrimonas balearica]MBY5990512.1 hypothetical protein [Ferrimonas balearica]
MTQQPPLPSPDSSCGKHFTYKDFIECSDSWVRARPSNVPQQLATYQAIDTLCQTVLDPIWAQFGPIKLTYGFSSASLVKVVKETPYPNITPSGDQHAGCELNRAGKPICPRLGQAVDCYVPGVSSLVVAQWAAQHTPFDRLYFYSAHRPFHISAGPDNSRSIVWMDGYRGGGHQPRVQSPQRFQSLSK